MTCIFWKILSVGVLILGCTSEKKHFVVKPQKNGINKSIKKKIAFNGCYYTAHQTPGDSKPRLNYFFFYENGVTLFYNAGEIDKDSASDKSYLKRMIQKDLIFKSGFFESKQSGGISIDGDQLQIQVFRFIPSPAWGLCPFKGKLVNDTTLFIADCEMDKRPDYCLDEFYLHFMEMPKPDSTNQLMKRKWYWQKI